MPLVTLTVRRPKDAGFKNAVLDSVHAALLTSGVPKDDLFHRVLELDASDFRFDPKYPDVASQRDDRFVLIEILLSVGRSVKVKRQITHDIVTRLQAGGFDPENVMIVFCETRWENWSFSGGRLIHA